MSNMIKLLYRILISLPQNPSKVRLFPKVALFLYYKLLGKNPVVCRISSPKKLTMVLDLNSHMDRNIFVNGLFNVYVEKYLTDFLLKHLKEDSVFFDIGANSGYFSLLAASKNKNISVHAFEPVPFVYENFQESVRMNNMKNVVVNNICIGDKKGKIAFYVASHSDVSSIRRTPYQDKAVRIISDMTTLPIYCKEKKIERIDIIKIDTEGNEKDILFSSKEILKKFRPILIVEFSSKTAQAFRFDPNDVYDFLTGLGYTIYSYKKGNFKRQEKKAFYEEDLYCLMEKKN